jgi:hypothetical protein
VFSRAAGLLAWPEARENVLLSTTGREAATSSAQPARLELKPDQRGQRTDLSTVPPDTSEPEARKAMDQAAEAGNQIHAPAILASITAAAPAPAPGPAPVPDLAPASAPAELAGSATS